MKTRQRRSRSLASGIDLLASEPIYCRALYITEDLLEYRFPFAGLLSALLTMDDQDASLQHWPNHRLKILIPTWTVLTISTLFVTWRVVYGLRNSRRFMVSDYLLIVATVSNVTNSSTTYA
jgi:hypothetical protein